MAPPPDSDVRPPAGRARRRVNVFIGAFLTFQLLVPLTYYLRDDPYDERFAWRMFSAIRVYGCRPEAVDVLDGPGERERLRRVRLYGVVHAAWVTTMRRNREPVIRAFLRRRCEEPDVVRARVVNRCVTPDGTRLPPLEYERDCGSGEVRAPEGEVVP